MDCVCALSLFLGYVAHVMLYMHVVQGDACETGLGNSMVDCLGNSMVDCVGNSMMACRIRGTADASDYQSVSQLEPMPDPFV